MKPKVIILSAFVTPMRSGAEACAEEVAKDLSDEFDVTVIAAKMHPGHKRRDTLDGGIPLVRVGFGLPFDKWLYPFLAAHKVNALKPDIAHAVLESFAGLALMLCKRSGAARILTCQSTNTSFLVKAMHRSADHVTVISKALRARAKRFGRADAVLIPNGLRLDHIPQDIKKIHGRIVFVGRLEKMKGIDTLLEAMKLLPPHIHLHIVGDGSQRQALQVNINMLGLHDRVKLVGHKPVPDVYDEFAQAQVFCGLSRSEAFGNVFIEAQAAGCAVVATNVGGIPDIVQHDQTGLLIEPDNAEAAAGAIERLIDDAGERERFARAGKRNAAGYQWSRIAEKYASVYRDALSSR